MTDHEMTEWIGAHDMGFPGFKDWFRAADTPELLQIRKRLWHGRLARYSYHQMVSQTEAMFSTREKPQYFSDHLDWICNRLSPRPQHNSSFSHGLKCEACNGTGIISVIFFDQRYTVGGQPLPGNRGPAACRCPIGQHLNERRAAHPECQKLPEWIDSQMVMDVAERPTAEELEECRQRLAESPGWLAVLDKVAIRKRKAVVR